MQLWHLRLLGQAKETHPLQLPPLWYAWVYEQVCLCVCVLHELHVLNVDLCNDRRTSCLMTRPDSSWALRSCSSPSSLWPSRVKFHLQFSSAAVTRVHSTHTHTHTHTPAHAYTGKVFYTDMLKYTKTKLEKHNEFQITLPRISHTLWVD